MILFPRTWNLVDLTRFLCLLLITTLAACSDTETNALSLSKKDVSYIMEQAESGDPEAQFSLAIMLDEGDRVDQDKQQAVTWFTRAAEQNLAGACLYLGIKYEYGNTVKQDSTRAAFLYRKAAMQGWPSAQFYLGSLYLKGDSIPINRVKAYTWLSLAAEHDYPGAEEEKNRILPLLSEEESKEAQQMIQEYLQLIYLQ